MQINDVDSDQAYDFLQGSVLVDMDASDTAKVHFYQPMSRVRYKMDYKSNFPANHPKMTLSTTFPAFASK